MIVDKLDLHFLYKNGFFRSHLTEAKADELLKIVQKEDFHLDSSSSCPVEDAPWDKGKSVELKILPAPYSNFFQEVLKSKFLEPYTKIYGEFTALNAALHKTPKNYINKWHGHFMDGFHLHLIFHLSEEIRTQADGGLIEYGYVLNPDEYSLDLQGYNMTEAKNIIQTGSFLANNGDFEVLLNTHPMYRHQVTEVLSNKNRYTLMMYFGYNDNILENKKWIDHL
jgi:hypothetical protein